MSLTHLFRKLPQQKGRKRFLVKDTISNIVKHVLREAGIDVNFFNTASCRGAASTKAYRMGISLARVLQQGRWSSEQVFRQHYLRMDARPILERKSSASFAVALRERN